jgi:hypothetical protein
MRAIALGFQKEARWLAPSGLLLCQSNRIIVYLINILCQAESACVRMFFVDTIIGMKKPKRGRPPKEADRLRSESLLVRLETTEKEAFRDAADVAGVPLSTWVRERLRQVAIRELDKASRPIPFLRPVR